MSDNISYSNNYKSMISGSVNERNGSFDFCTGIVNIVGNNLKGPELNLSVSFDRFKSLDMGLGQGLIFSLPYFDCSKAIFYTDQGVSVKLSGNDLTRPIEACLKNFKITFSNRVYKVKYHDGSIDEFKKSGNGKVAYLVKRSDSSGNSLFIHWNNDKITKITDSNESEFLSLESASDKLGYEISLLSGRYFIYTKIKSDFSTIKVTTPYFIKGQFSQALSYDIAIRLSTNVGYYLIDRIELPNRSVQNIVYGENNDESLVGYNGKRYAVVKEHTIETGGSIIKRTSYDFKPVVDGSDEYPYKKGYNAYGFGVTVSPVQGSDPTYSIVKPYFYKVIVTEFDHESQARVVESIYDKFHNLREQKKSFKGCAEIDSFYYYTNDDKDISGQESRFKLTKSVKKKYVEPNGLFKTEEYRYDFDTFGNILSECDLTKRISIDYQYYDTRNSAVDGCPEYSDFIFFLKSQTITDLAEDTSLSRTVSYRKYNKVAGCILLESETNPYADTSIKFAYHQSGADAGRLLTREVYLGAQQCSMQQFSYIEENIGLVVESSTFSDGVPGEHLSTRLELDKLTGQKVFISANGAESRFEYYPDGRLKTEICSPGSINQAVRTFQYFDEEGWVDCSDQFNNIKRTVYDALGNVKSISLTIPNVVTDYTIESNTYNLLGQKISTTVYDTTIGNKSASRSWQLTTTYDYDGWMNVQHTYHPDGVVEFSIFEVINNKTSSGIQGQNYTVTESDFVQRKQFNKVYDTNNTLINSEEISFDGFDNIIQKTNGFGIKTAYSYDKMNRPTSLQTTFIDTEKNECKIFKEISYAAHDIGGECVESIIVNNKQLGRNTYDAFSRLREQEVNGKVTVMSYEPGKMTHYQVTKPDGKIVSSDYDPEFGIYTRTGSREQIPNLKGLVQQAFDSVTQSSIQYHYRFDGLLEREIINDEQWSYEYTLLGQPTISIMPGDNCEIIEYDDFMRIKSINDGINYTEYSDFDTFSRPQSVEVSGATPMNMTFDYTGLPRTMKSKLVQGDDILSEVENYTSDGKIETKITTLGQQELVENFEYDAMRRLVKYTASGSVELLSKDELGKEIVEQRFKFDNFGNIEEVTTFTLDQKMNVSTYHYNPDYPTQLYSIQHTNHEYSDLDFQHSYDHNGALCEDQNGNKYEYNDYGELVRVTNNQMIELTSYEYDAIGRLYKQFIPNEPAIEYQYANDNLIYLKQGELGVSSSIVNGRLVSKRFKTLDRELISDYLCNNSNSPLKVKRGNTISQQYSYTPYGLRT
ncbi:hypothetical protein F0Q18_00475 [Vibrio cholerae]|nr:hypothetical protein F0Q18_00475 [Vibrio cholerae]